MKIAGRNGQLFSYFSGFPAMDEEEPLALFGSIRVHVLGRGKGELRMGRPRPRTTDARALRYSWRRVRTWGKRQAGLPRPLVTPTVRRLLPQPLPPDPDQTDKPGTEQPYGARDGDRGYSERGPCGNGSWINRSDAISVLNGKRST